MKNSCPECGNNDLRMINNEEICNTCGLVLDEGIAQPFITEITKKYAEIPSIATAGTKKQDGRIFQHQWLLNTREKNIESSNSIIELIASKHRLTNQVILEAKTIYENALRNKFTIGRDTNTLLYACIYIACQIHKIPKIPRELILNTEITKTKLLRTHKLLKRELHIQTKNLKAIDFVERFGNKLKLEQPIIQEAIKIIEKTENIMTGKRPETITATALYLSAKKNRIKISQRKIANTTGTMEVTIRKTSKVIAQFIEIR